MSAAIELNDDPRGDMEGLLSAALAIARLILRDTDHSWGSPASGLVTVLEHAVEAYGVLIAVGQPVDTQPAP